MNAQEFDLFDLGSMKFTTFQWGGPINSIQTSFVTNVKVMQFKLCCLASLLAHLIYNSVMTVVKFLSDADEIQKIQINLLYGSFDIL